jgi:hypothetical protein
MMFDLDNVDYVGPICALIDDGDFDGARALLQEVPTKLRESVRWTIASMKNIVL